MQQLSVRDTPILVVGDGSDLEARYKEELARVEASPGVAAAIESLNQVEARRDKLSDAFSRINIRAKDLRDALASADSVIRDALVEDGTQPTIDKAVKARMFAQAELFAAIDTIRHLAEDAIPAARIDVTRCEVNLFVRRAEGCEALANELAEEMVATLSQAAGTMGSIQVDVSQGIAGLLTARANLERQRFLMAREQLREQEDKLNARRQQAMVQGRGR